MPKTILECPKCHAHMSPDLWSRHQCPTSLDPIKWPRSSADPNEIVGRRLRGRAPCVICGAHILPSLVRDHLRRVHQVNAELILISQRGIRLDRTARCAFCGVKRRPVWNYAQSSQGPVAVCSKCKPWVFDLSFGYKDALHGALRGGAWEQDRRRH